MHLYKTQLNQQAPKASGAPAKTVGCVWSAHIIREHRKSSNISDPTRGSHRFLPFEVQSRYARDLDLSSRRRAGVFPVVVRLRGND
jgi:hypothetical protein